MECANINVLKKVVNPFIHHDHHETFPAPLRVPGVASSTAVPTLAAHDLAAAKGTLNGLACAAKF